MKRFFVITAPAAADLVIDYQAKANGLPKMLDPFGCYYRFSAMRVERDRDDPYLWNISLTFTPAAMGRLIVDARPWWQRLWAFVCATYRTAGKNIYPDEPSAWLAEEEGEP